MTTLDTAITTIRRTDSDAPLDEAQLAAAAFLARYSGRTLDAYRHNLRMYFHWPVPELETIQAPSSPNAGSVTFATVADRHM